MRFKSNLKFINFSSEINSRVKNYEWIDFQLNHATTSKIKNTDILKNNFHDFITLGLYAYFVRLNNYFDFTCYYDKYQTSFKILLIEKIKEINILDFLNIPNHISRYLYADIYDNYPYVIAILTKNYQLS